MSPDQPLLQLEGISKHFGPVQALDRVDFAVETERKEKDHEEEKREKRDTKNKSEKGSK